MKFFRYLIKLCLTIAILVMAALAFSQKAGFLKPDPCAKPLTYSLGDIDPRFNISNDELMKDVVQAENVLEKPAGKNLFQYDPNATFKINLVYDDRQERTDASQKLEGQLDKLKSSHEIVTGQYNSLSDAYKKRLDDYNKSAKDYQKSLSAYNAEVDKWNSSGGAPADEYDKLKKEKKDLNGTWQDLEKERVAINSLIDKANNLADKEGQIVDTYNENLDTYKNKYGDARQFDQGVYYGDRIDIYEFHDDNDLRLVLAHEMGHALGIDHQENPQSIMYYMMGEQDMTNPHLSPEDVTALKDVCHLN